MASHWASVYHDIVASALRCLIHDCFLELLIHAVSHHRVYGFIWQVWRLYRILQTLLLLLLLLVIHLNRVILILLLRVVELRIHSFLNVILGQIVAKQSLVGRVSAVSDRS